MKKSTGKKGVHASGTSKCPKNSATTRSTAGSGFDFEDQVAAWFLLKMLTGESMPSTSDWFGTRLQSQTKSLGWFIDDLLITCKSKNQETHLALSCKSNMQVSKNGLPPDFISSAWKQFENSGAGPLHNGLDLMVLMTRGWNQTFQTVWTDIKMDCTGSDPSLAIARIRAIKNRLNIFNSIKEVVQTLSEAARDEDIIEFVRHLLVIQTDFQIVPSKDLESAILKCRNLLTSDALEEDRELWQALVKRSRDCRLGNGTIDLPQLWNELRSQFKLKDQPDFASGWKRIRALTNDHLDKIETELPSGHTLARSEDGERFVHAITKNPIVIFYGESGVGKSSLAKIFLNSQVSQIPHIWFGPDTLSIVLNEIDRLKIDLLHPLHITLKATTSPSNILVIDSAERIKSELIPKVKQLVRELLAENAYSEIPVWRILIIGQTEALTNGTLQNLIDGKQPVILQLNPASHDEVQKALRSLSVLNWLAFQNEAVKILGNLKALAWVMQAAHRFQQYEHQEHLSLTVIADSLWDFWTEGKLCLKKVLMKLSEREASFECSIALSELTGSEALAIEQRPEQLPLQITSRNHLKFQHDLAADWARFQRLKEISGNTAKWNDLSINPLWTAALRMLGQFLLRENSGDRSEWDISFEKLDAIQQRGGADILLDALFLDPLAELFLTNRTELLFADDGSLLKRMLLRFQHIATEPSSQSPLPLSDPSLGLYIEAQHRSPIIARWPPVIRFLSAHRDRVARLMSPAVAKMCERWLTTMPIELNPGTPIPFRKNLAEIALYTARELQAAQGKDIPIGYSSKKPIYTAALAGAADLSDEVSQWALEMAHRRPWRDDIVEQIIEFHRQQEVKHAERLRTDLIYRARHQHREQMQISLSTSRKLPPWPLGPQDRVDSDFRECCTHLHSLSPLMKAKPNTASEVLLAVLIEDSPEEDYSLHSSSRDHYGLGYDYRSYPTAYWQSPFYDFLHIAPDIALDTLIKLVDFCTDRWDYNRNRHGADRISIVLDLPWGTKKEYVGDHIVLNWNQENSANSGQLHCALTALEKWLCVALEEGADIIDSIQLLLDGSHSVAILGVLLNVGKCRPILFKGLLRPLLSHPRLYLWDEYRINVLKYSFDQMSWAQQGEAVFQKAREWWNAPYRRVLLSTIAANLVAFDPEIADYLSTIIKKWELPEDNKDRLNQRKLKAQLDRTNYKEAPEGLKSQIHFEYPESLRKDIAIFLNETEPTRRLLILPYECEQLLDDKVELTIEITKKLADFLCTSFSCLNTYVKEDYKRLANIAVASILLSRARNWLNDFPEILNIARKTVRDFVNQIPDNIELFQGRIGISNAEIKFVAYAVIHDFISSPSIETEHAVIRVLTNGSEEAVKTLTSIGYAHRVQLGCDWWRLLEISLLWCALTTLAPRPDEPLRRHNLWGHWLKRLRNCKLKAKGTTLASIDPVALANRVERFQNQLCASESNQKFIRVVREHGKRHSSGLDTHFLKAMFFWLFQSPSESTQQPDPQDTNTRHKLLKRLVDFELWQYDWREEDDNYRTPTNINIGYEIVPAIVNLMPRLNVKVATDLWQPLFQHGGKAHYILDHFISYWFKLVTSNIEITVFVSHWKAMIEYALASPQWNSGPQWFECEKLICRLVGCGSTLLLDKNVGLQTEVLQMKNLYESWANEYLKRDEDNISYFCVFLGSSTGRLLRLDGLYWLHCSIQKKSEGNLRCRNSYTFSAIADLIDILLKENADELITTPLSLNALLELVAILVKQETPTALALQDRVRKKFSNG